MFLFNWRSAQAFWRCCRVSMVSISGFWIVCSNRSGLAAFRGSASWYAIWYSCWRVAVSLTCRQAGRQAWLVLLHFNKVHHPRWHALTCTTADTTTATKGTIYSSSGKQEVWWCTCLHHVLISWNHVWIPYGLLAPCTGACTHLWNCFGGVWCELIYTWQLFMYPLIENSVFWISAGINVLPYSDYMSNLLFLHCKINIKQYFALKTLARGSVLHTWIAHLISFLDDA